VLDWPMGWNTSMLTGTFRQGFTTDCITTAAVDVRLKSDPLLFSRGFRVDAALSC
jgi:hypothetical protein